MNFGTIFMLGCLLTLIACSRDYIIQEHQATITQGYECSYMDKIDGKHIIKICDTKDECASYCDAARKEFMDKR